MKILDVVSYWFHPCIIFFKYEIGIPRVRSFSDLQDIDSERRALNRRTRLSGLYLLLSMSGTLFTSLAFDMQFWFTITVYFAARLYSGFLHHTLPALTASTITVSSSVLVFLLVFYVTQSYSRYLLQYDAAMSCEGRIFDICLLCKSNLPFATSWQIPVHQRRSHSWLCWPRLGLR